MATKGTKKYADSAYEGMLLGDERHGKGALSYTSGPHAGKTYTGDWVSVPPHNSKYGLHARRGKARNPPQGYLTPIAGIICVLTFGRICVRDGRLTTSATAKARPCLRRMVRLPSSAGLCRTTLSNGVPPRLSFVHFATDRTIRGCGVAREITHTFETV